MYRCLLIDLDDTLWDTFENNRESLKEVYAARSWGQYCTSFEAFFSRYLPYNEQLWRGYRMGRISKPELIISRFRLPLSEFGIELSNEEILELNREFLQYTGQKTRLCLGAVETLTYLHRYYVICILSNGFREVQDAKIQNSGLAPHIDRMVLSEDIGINKPHKLIFDRALSACRARRNDTLVIGDSPEADILGAHNAGIDSFWYNPKSIPFPEEIVCRRPLRIFSNLTELCSLL